MLLFSAIAGPPPLPRTVKLKLFLYSFLATLCAVLAFAYATGHQERPQSIANGVFLSSQVTPADLHSVSQRYHLSTIVDFRPDGEAPDQPSSAEMRAAAVESHLDFHYIPVPHESIPADAVKSLQLVLAKAGARPVLLYCRTGRRAVRLFALTEASRPDGPATDQILEMVSGAGFGAEDLKPEIEARTARRDAKLQTR